jgi:hypothetical protein
MADPSAIGGRNRCFCSSVPANSSGRVASLLTAGISEVEAQTRATSSTSRQWVIESAPAPP